MLTTCAACGQPMPSTAAFCGCGRPAWRTCSRCGGPVGARARWCGTCGSDTGNFAGASPDAAVPVPPAPPTPMWPGLAGDIPAAGADWVGAGTARASAPRRSLSQPPVLIGGAIVMLVIAIVGAVIAFGGAPSIRPSGTGATASLTVAEARMDGPTFINVPADVIRSTAVTPGGGTVAADGVTVVVPEGAVAVDTTVVIRRLNAPFDMNVAADAEPEASEAEPGAVDAIPIGPAYDFGPTGTQFAQPVDVTLPFKLEDAGLGVSAPGVGGGWGVRATCEHGSGSVELAWAFPDAAGMAGSTFEIIASGGSIGRDSWTYRYEWRP